MSQLPTISSLPSLPESERNSILDTLFEPSPAIHALAHPIISSSDGEAAAPTLQLFHSYEDLIELIGVGMKTLADSPRKEDIEVLDGILSAHPRLGEKKVESELSRKEQAAMNAASAEEEEEERSREEEAEMLRSLNDEYEAMFPGLRYVVFVNGRPRPVIMEDMRQRIARGDIDAERKEAIEAMCEIACDRAKKLQ